MNSIFVANNVDTSLPLSPNFKTTTSNSNFDVNINPIVQLQNPLLYPLLVVDYILQNVLGLGFSVIYATINITYFPYCEGGGRNMA
jgi:hypothetical protein